MLGGAILLDVARLDNSALMIYAKSSLDARFFDFFYHDFRIDQYSRADQQSRALVHKSARHLAEPKFFATKNHGMAGIWPHARSNDDFRLVVERQVCDYLSLTFITELPTRDDETRQIITSAMSGV